MAIATNSFDSWLSKKLQALHADENVFGSYITGILESDDTEDEKIDALKTILAGMTDDGHSDCEDDSISEHVKEILAAWIRWVPTEQSADPVTGDVAGRLRDLLDLQSIPKTTQRSYTEEERRIRDAILAQYSQTSADEKSDAEDEEVEVGGDNCRIEKNTNAAVIAQQVKEKREKAKIDSQKKKEKDKEDREKQKQMKEEKKEKRKTQKGERRR